MYNIFHKIWDNFQLLFHPIIINAYVFFKGSRVQHTNWGDDLNWYLLRKLTDKKILFFDQVSLAMRLNLKNYLVIGSTIDMLGRTSSDVWGAGLIGNQTLRNRPHRIHAVRGPLTRKALLEQGIPCPEIYGDPAMLAPLVYHPKIEKKFKYGLIPHCSNVQEAQSLKFGNKPIGDREDVLLIDMSTYEKWTDIIDKVCSCENILSCSLHGLIIAEAYNIPNVWLEFGKPLIGGHFKFHDFFLSIKRDRENPITIEANNISELEVNHAIERWQNGEFDPQPLLSACPFKLKIS